MLTYTNRRKWTTGTCQRHAAWCSENSRISNSTSTVRLWEILCWKRIQTTRVFLCLWVCMWFCVCVCVCVCQFLYTIKWCNTYTCVAIVRYVSIYRRNTYMYIYIYICIYSVVVHLLKQSHHSHMIYAHQLKTKHACVQVPDGKLKIILYQSEKVSDEVDAAAISDAFRITAQTLPARQVCIRV
jgi:hypothetical protein